ncbi:unnamed protein product, partial [Rotaria sp. Silwood1]
SLNPYCEITVGSLTLKTLFMRRTNNPKWNTSMQFSLYDVAKDIIHINIFDNEFFSPNGSLNPYCEITVGSLTLKTPFMKRTNNPKWNTSMQFSLYDFAKDIIHINIFDNEFFSPNDILPCSLDIFLTQPSQSFTQTIYLNNGASVIMKCTIQFLL